MIGDDKSRHVWDGCTVMLTGGVGLLESHHVEEFRSRSDSVKIFVTRSREYYFQEKPDVQRAFGDPMVDMVIRPVAIVGELVQMLRILSDTFYDNIVIGIKLMQQARQFGVKKMNVLRTIYSYPKHTPVPFSEDDLYNRYLKETNAPYGIEKSYY